MANPPRTDPPKECDLVMKGGLTSGVVYPSAILELASEYRFRSIGGSSAGAIAAALAAASEFGRGTGGFEKLDRCKADLTQHGFLFNLFQPTESLRPAFEFLVQQAEKPKDGLFKRGWSFLKDLSGITPWWPFAGGLAVGFVFTLVLFGASTKFIYAQIMLVGLWALLGLIVGFALMIHGAAENLKGTVRDLVDNDFGFVKGIRGVKADLALPEAQQEPEKGVAKEAAIEPSNPLAEGAPEAGKDAVSETPNPQNQEVQDKEATQGSATGTPNPHEHGEQETAAVQDATPKLEKTPEDKGAKDAIAGSETSRVERSIGRLLQRMNRLLTRSHKSAQEDKKLRDPALTEWIASAVDFCAGRLGDLGHDIDPEAVGSPLTFADLEAKGIKLKLVTSNLSQGQPYAIPFADDQWFIFNKKEMEGLFPRRVVDHLMRHRRFPPPDLKIKLELPTGYYFLPAGKNLPVVFGARLSLSFPILFSTVPLWTLNPQIFKLEHNEPLVADRHLLRNVFSDGGITSNFPIHFFDGWLPERPTFGINLIGWPKKKDLVTDEESGAFFEAIVNLTPDSGSSDRAYANTDSSTSTPSAAPEQSLEEREEAVFLPKPNQVWNPEYFQINSIGGFIMSVFTTSKDFQDNLHARLPSVRDRVVNIRMRNDEGGLALTMPTSKIQILMDRGGQAGKLLQNFDFDSHRWLRARVLFPELAEGLDCLNSAGTWITHEDPVMRSLGMDDPWRKDVRRLWGWLEGRKVEDLPDLMKNRTKPDVAMRITMEM